ncbi:MAG: carbohydrate ABC transporter permease [Acholeplasmataceae bacterium]|nr:carbohydrate ABC transporter permease [Acholeplasmataceae bacterium]
MEKNFQEVFSQDLTTKTESSYAPIIKELTLKEYRALKIKNRIKYVLKIINYILLIIVGATFLYPFLWMLVMSLRSYNDAIRFNPSLILTEVHWENYLQAWKSAKMGIYLGNSVTYAVLVLSLQYLFIVPSAYAFARMEFKGNKLLFWIKQIGMMLPGEATFIPIYFFYSKIGLIDTWTGLIMPHLVAMFGIYMFMNHFKTVPKEIIESARLDKSGHGKIMLRIMIPIIFPVFVTHFLLTFISNWNSYYWVMVMTNTEKLKTLPVAVRGLLRVEGVVPEWQKVMAGNIIQLAPILLMYMFGSSQMKRAMIGGRKIKFAGEKDNIFKRAFSSIKGRFKSTEKKQASI